MDISAYVGWILDPDAHFQLPIGRYPDIIGPRGHDGLAQETQAHRGGPRCGTIIGGDPQILGRVEYRNPDEFIGGICVGER